MVLFIDLQVLGEVIDTPCQQGNLDLRRTGVVRVRAIFIYNNLRVVHEVLSYASKWSGECPRGMIARSRSISALQKSAFGFQPSQCLDTSGDDGFNFDLYEPAGVQQSSDHDHCCCGL
jgi:hypothetical protein